MLLNGCQRSSSFSSYASGIRIASRSRTSNCRALHPSGHLGRPRFFSYETATPTAAPAVLPPRGRDPRRSQPTSRPVGGHSYGTMPDTPQRRFQRPAIFICDIQDKFRAAIWNFDAVVNTSVKVLRAAHTLGLPVHVTTQNSAKLGGTVSELRAYLEPNVDATAPSAPASSQPPSSSPASGPVAARVYPNVDKTKFSMWVPEVAARFDGAGAPHECVIVGIESHVCVTQTALDLLAAGHKVYVLADGVSSCNREEVGVALDRLRAEGAVVSTSESLLYELLGDAAAPGFKGLVGLVKETSAQTRQTLQALL